ncbi:MAG: radical SAM protein [Theionarchaea archaeon]|nr:radical SAM protein [Theionarchaea archaeon]
MILNCTPPYNLHIPNPALGYLKGFLEAHDISVRNVYWNLVLAESISTFQKGLKEYAPSNDLFSVLPVMYLFRQLKSYSETPLHLFYLSIYSEEELVNMIHTIKDFIDYYIKVNDLHKTTLAGFTLKSYQWLPALYLIDRLKYLNPDILIVIGGVYNEEQGQAFMKISPQVDFAIYGEGEYPLFSLARAVEEETSIEEVPNLIYRNNGKMHSTRKSQNHQDLDSYPFADHSDYIETFKKVISGRILSEYIEVYGRHASDQYPVILPIYGSRSCPWNKCKFCVLNEEYSYRCRTPENIVKEIEYQSEIYKVDSFIFVDTELPGNVNRFNLLLKLLMHSSAEKEKRYRFFAEISPIFVNSETAYYMQLASFAEIQIGFEGMTDSLLKKMQKRHRFAHNIQALKLGDLYGLTIKGINVIRGTPEETDEDILESCRNVKFLRFLLNRYTVNPVPLRLDKGSPFYEEVLESERNDWRNNPIWAEVNTGDIIQEDDRFEFFGFTNVEQNRLWNDFANLLKSYMRQNHSYEWIEYGTGSFVEEKGLRIYRYVFDRDETDLLIFCNSIKSLSDVKKRLPHLDEKRICEMLDTLKDAGFLYHDKDSNEIISVVEAEKRRILVY